MKEYNKEKLHEYAKELFALCLSKEIEIEFNKISVYVYFNDLPYYYAYINKDMYNFKMDKCVPIWELIEKVKAL